jgi:hypothetical protein
MKLILASAMMLCASSLAAYADSFSFSSTSHTVNQLSAMVPGGGKPVLAAFSNGSATNTYASGKQTKSTSTCAFWTAEPGSQFTFVGACNVTEEGGDQSSIAASCAAANNAQTEGDCWGVMMGTSGSHKGKSGTITWHQKAGADDKSGMAWGVGQWND